MAERTVLWRAIAGAYGLSGVIIGAVAAHALAEPRAAALVGQAALYQLVHAAALLAVAPVRGWAALLAKLGFAAGVTLFSGSIIVRHLAGLPAIGALAPFGGFCLMAGWAGVLLAAFDRTGRREGDAARERDRRSR